MNSVARSLGEYLCSRNNDIAGYWGIGVLCLAAKRAKRNRFSFKIRPGQKIMIDGREVSDSIIVTEKLVKHRLDSIEGRLSFFEDGRYPNGADKYTCGIAIAVTQDGRTGLFVCHVACWPHDAMQERRRAIRTPAATSLFARIKNLIK